MQRGELAIANFESRKNICMQYGVDEVYELDFAYATQAAHVFAQGAVKTAVQANVNILVFGSETNDVDLLYKIAKTIKAQEKHYYQLVRQELKKGISFAKANQLVLETLIGHSVVLPNDILALEYVKAIVQNDYPIQAISMARTTGYHSQTAVGQIASATYIRQLIFAKNLDYQQYTPMRFEQMPDRIENHYSQFQELVLKMNLNELKQIQLIAEGMEGLFKKHIHLKTYEAFVDACTSRRYTASRIKRVMLYVLLQIKKPNNLLI